MQIRLWGMALSIIVGVASGVAEAGSVLDAIKARGQFVCGTRGDTQGFARRDDGL